jgi:5'-nucleotidase (lipoprotein e(P4) family)
LYNKKNSKLLQVASCNFGVQFLVMYKYIFLLLITAASCKAAKQAITPIAQPATVVNGKLFASVFQQRAAEYKALCFQAYNLARLRLNEQLAIGAKPKAIITDIDETVLDNSPYAVHQALLGRDYDQDSWYEWTAKAEADTVAGAPSFLKYASSKGVTIFYITNRNEKERAATLKNLQKYNLPNADDPHLILRTDVSSKETRRQQVMANYDVVLLLGDNLADFSPLFDKKPLEERDQNARSIAGSFGNRFIVLPNPGYGDWESALYGYKALTLSQKDSAIRSSVKSY